MITFAHLQAEILSQIDQMGHALADGETLNFSKRMGSNWALLCGGWSEKHWQPIAFAHQDGDLALAGVADIYNRHELAEQHRLPPHIGALIMACYRADEQKWPLQIRGNFAVIIIDSHKQRLIAATDRVGMRPLYWCQQGGVYYLGSRLKTLQQVYPSLAIDQQAIYAYMQHSMIPSPATIYQGVQKLEPGFMLEAGAKQLKLTQYWDIAATPKLVDAEKRLAHKIYQSISDAVAVNRNGIAAEAELGCFLSGGTDSSTICGLLSKSAARPVAAYSIGFPENGYDEMFYARVAAKAYGLAHHEHYLQPPDVLQILPAIVAAYDEPFGNASAIPTFYCVRAAAQNGVRFMLAGDGGDEIFAGNTRYGEQQRFRNYFKIPRLVRAGMLEPFLLNRFEKAPVRILRKGGSYIRRAKMPDLLRLQSYRYWSDTELFSPDFLRARRTTAESEITAKHFNALSDAAPLDRHLYLDMKLTITDNDLRKVTRMCELAHVRPRYPLLDHSVIELGFQIPARLKLRGANGLRYIFKQAFRDLLPPEILTKPKHGFGLPISQWLRRDPQIKSFAHDLLLSARHLQRGYFRPEFIRKLWDLQLNDSTPYYGAIVWQLVMLEAWHVSHAQENESALAEAAARAAAFNG